MSSRRHQKGRIGVRFRISMDYSFNSFKINLHCYKLKDFCVYEGELGI